MPLICLPFVVMMAFLCFRMMRGCMVGHGRRASGEIEDLRTQIRELREEIRKLRDQGTLLRVAQAQFGRSHMTTTFQVYSHARASAQRQVVDQLESLLFPSVPNCKSRPTAESVSD
jgi:hypothetical protein